MKKVLYFFCLILEAAACKKVYNVRAIGSNYNYLVVEGLINTGADSTLFKLSRTVNIAAKTTNSPELNAQLIIEDNKSNSYPLYENGSGNYGAASLNLDYTRKYRLRVKTADGKTYLSDFVEARVTPPIDSLGYSIQPNGLQVYLNAYDPTNNTRYYRWDYSETWVFYSKFSSYFKLVDGIPAARQLPQEQVTQCWGADSSTTLLLASTSGLSKDIISQQNIVALPSTSEKLQSRYSILVTQYALTNDAYAYYRDLKKNTEDLGDIFGNLPSSGLTGNIHNINNSTEPVIGYVTAGTRTQKRIYINNRDLPAWRTITFYDTYGCAADTATVKSADAYPFYYGGNPPAYLPTNSPNFAAFDICVDCTLRGTNKQPKFWK